MQHGFKDCAYACNSVAYVGALTMVMPLCVFYEVWALFYYWYHTPSGVGGSGSATVRQYTFLSGYSLP